MLILGIESSCDETAAAVVRDGHELLSNAVKSQIDIHAAYGGVIPEIAARSHIEVILPVIEKALADARVSWDDIDAMAVTHAPGLIGSLLVGSLAARTLAYIKQKPLYGIHHVEAHTYANFLTDGIKLSIPYPERQPDFPLLSLTVSGGHSQLVLFEGHGKYRLLGQTRDDAVGEAFDKVAKIIGLPYPGGPSIAKAAEAGNAQKYVLPKAKLQNPYDFSFSGLKTAVLRAVQRECGVDHTFPSFKLSERLDDVKRADFAASFQRVAVETLVDKTVKAYEEFQPKSVVIAGGVAANQELRRQLKDRLPTDIAYAPMELCTDNGAMVAALGYYHATLRAPDNPLSLSVVPSLSMTKTPWQ
ncbi:MAG TPA: tRNA (adenosine(37)-N6)-threonylcarbamoyltransferase complex transferase subunit TsaD [Candidatus Saccharimonadales bacterium]|nr:tRNA (adenosine(37)-N6)-threonylcarbamoyltransferase complex transferase subunit TsaD [Candidatus Saccharimonadales bacterium]